MLIDTYSTGDYKKDMSTRKLEAVLGADSTALIKAVSKGRFKLTKLLVEGGAEINTKDGDGRSALMVACMLKPNEKDNDLQLRLIKLLLENGANINDTDKHGKTALIYACSEKGSSDVVETLLLSEADPRAVDRSGSSALVHAVNSGNSDVLTLLVNACKAKGKEVIIITTKENNNDKRETRQYLDVPPPLVKTPPVYKCVEPRDISYHLPQQLTEEQSNAKQDVAKDVCINVSGDEVNAKPGDLLHSSMNVPITCLPAPLYTLNRRESIGHINVSSFRAALPEEDEVDDSNEVVLRITDPTKSVSPRRKRILRRRQSSDSFYADTNQGRWSHEGSMSSLCSSCHSMVSSSRNRSLTNSPEPRPPVSSPKTIKERRRRSLPGMPPPLRKSQTVHAIRVPGYLLEDCKASSPARSCPDYLQDQKLAEEDETGTGDESWDSESSINDMKASHFTEGIAPSIAQHAGVQQNKVRCRRGSAPHLLNDELAQKRPGFLPALKTNPDVPIPSIGCSFESITDSKPRFSRLDRRCSFQADDIGRLTKLFNPTLVRDRSCSQDELSKTGL